MQCFYSGTPITHSVGQHQRNDRSPGQQGRRWLTPQGRPVPVYRLNANSMARFGVSFRKYIDSYAHFLCALLSENFNLYFHFQFVVRISFFFLIFSFVLVYHGPGISALGLQT